jgi:hypothetical protein
MAPRALMRFKEAVFMTTCPACAHSTKSVNSVSLVKVQGEKGLVWVRQQPRTSYPHSQKAFFNVLNGDFRLVAAPLIILQARARAAASAAELYISPGWREEKNADSHSRSGGALLRGQGCGGRRQAAVLFLLNSNTTASNEVLKLPEKIVSAHKLCTVNAKIYFQEV